ncbi:MAG TPA: 3-oxoacyl-ACP reductase FabG [Gelria sp.]|nr:3-oxoacyl-ACP reductase FabG [Gelria sp.]
MLKYLEGHICLVTGSSRGIGAQIARSVAAAGARTVINYFSSEQKAMQLLAELTEQGYQVMAVQADVSQSHEVEDMFTRIEAKWGSVDLLVNNAGISLKRLVTETREEEWQQVMDINLKSAFLCCRRALPAMVRNRYGRIINIASIWGLRGASCESVYAASKGGLIAFSRSLAAEMGPSGINVNVVAPGPVETDMLIQELDNDERAVLSEDIPLGRLASPDDVASACLFLLSPAASYINGQVLGLDGGWKV